MNKVVNGALMVLDINILRVDPSYQREIKRKHKKIISDFKKEAFGVPLIGQRQDMSMWIVDGLQRITALRQLGKTKVRAEVFPSHGPEHEAEIFKLVNLNRTRLTPGEEFNALLTSKDQLALDIKNAVESSGFALSLKGHGSRCGNAEAASLQVGCVATLVQVAKTQGIDPIKFALKCAKEAWPGDPKGTNNYIVHGLCTYYHRHAGMIYADRLIPKLATVTPHKLLYTAGQMAGGSGGAVNSLIADLIEKTSRKRIKQ